METEKQCQMHERESILDSALEFLSTRYKHENFKFIKFVEILPLPNAAPWLCVFDDTVLNKQRLVTMLDCEWQTITTSVLSAMQQQLAQSLKDVKSVLKRA